MSGFPDYSLEWIMTELHKTNRFISLLITQSALYILIIRARNHPFATGGLFFFLDSCLFLLSLEPGVVRYFTGKCHFACHLSNFSFQWMGCLTGSDVSRMENLPPLDCVCVCRAALILLKKLSVCKPAQRWTSCLTAAFKEHTDCFHYAGCLRAVIGWFEFILFA